jgi:hypothetical protein
VLSYNLVLFNGYYAGFARQPGGLRPTSNSETVVLPSFQVSQLAVGGNSFPKLGGRHIGMLFERGVEGRL